MTDQGTNQGADQPVEQFIPVAWIKRISVWQNQRYIQL